VPARRAKNRAEPVDTEAAPVAVREVPEPTGTREQSLPFLLLLLAASGCAALIYEIVWFQLLQLVIGSSAVSLGLLLAAYMGGLCIGSAALSRVVPASQHPLRIYAFLELGIGAFGILALFGVPLIGRLYIAGPTTGIAGVILRGLIAAICLLPPTVLMGASFPAIARRAGSVSRLGMLYSANIAGAVLGCLFAGFYLLRVYDMAVATYTAAAINVAAAALAFALVAHVSHEGGTVPEVPEAPARRAPGAAII
jgi:spermidine synthase